MALDDTAVIVPGTGHIYLAPAETAEPASLTAPASPWEHAGHTSRDDGVTITREGGDSTILGTWQNTALRERRDPTTFALTWRLHQVTNDTLELYFGGADISGAGTFGVPQTLGTIQRAVFIRLVDGVDEVALYAPKASISAEDDIEVDVENFLTFAVRASILGVTGSNLMEFFHARLGTTPAP